jgi:hypothetical protein
MDATGAQIVPSADPSCTFIPEARTCMRNLSTLLLVLLASTLVNAHVGSADVYYEGDAGPYHLFVTVRLPQVIPGVAEIQVRSASPNVQTLRVVILRLTGVGSNLPPTPDLALRSKDDPQFFVCNLWLMEFGALQVRIEADGSKGKAELSVPVASYARQSLPMGRALRVLGAFFLVFLTLSLVPIIGAVVRESSISPGETPQASNRRRARIVMATTLIVAVVILYLNRELWNEEAATYKRNVELLKPPRAETTLLDGNRLLMIRPASQLMVPVAGMGRSARKVSMDEVIPDHGHVMHLFLIDLPGMERMWHLHPDRAKGGAFAQRLPAMPAGQYEIFADIVDKNGFPWTLVGNLDLPQIIGAPIAGDDSDWEGARLTNPLSETRIAQLPDGGRMVWEGNDGPLKANVPASFRFRVEEKDGSPAHDLEPYMGMAAHAEVVCTDLSVFAHIHPNGSVSMAALDLAQAGLIAQSAVGVSGMAMEMARSPSVLPPEFNFPYGFPHPGDYRIFVQIKRSGQAQTAAFDAHVQ